MIPDCVTTTIRIPVCPAAIRRYGGPSTRVPPMTMRIRARRNAWGRPPLPLFRRVSVATVTRFVCREKAGLASVSSIKTVVTSRAARSFRPINKWEKGRVTVASRIVARLSVIRTPLLRFRPPPKNLAHPLRNPPLHQTNPAPPRKNPLPHLWSLLPNPLPPHSRITSARIPMPMGVWKSRMVRRREEVRPRNMVQSSAETLRVLMIAPSTVLKRRTQSSAISSIATSASTFLSLAARNGTGPLSTAKPPATTSSRAGRTISHSPYKMKMCHGEVPRTCGATNYTHSIAHSWPAGAGTSG
jgi:hypothetical protein